MGGLILDVHTWRLGPLKWLLSRLWNILCIYLLQTFFIGVLCIFMYAENCYDISKDIKYVEITFYEYSITLKTVPTHCVVDTVVIYYCI